MNPAPEERSLSPSTTDRGLVKLVGHADGARRSARSAAVTLAAAAYQSSAHIGGSARGYQRASAPSAIPTMAEQAACRAVCFCIANAGRVAASAADSPVSLWVVSRLILLFSWLGTIVADPCQGHRLIAGGTESAGPAVLPVVAATVARSMTSLDTGLAGAQGLHLFLSGQLRSAQDGTVSPFKVAAVRVMAESWLGSCGRAVKVHLCVPRISSTALTSRVARSVLRA